MKISIINESKFNLPVKMISLKKEINYLMKIIVSTEKVDFDYVNFLLCDDKEITIFNRNYLKHNYPTDVISFNYNENAKIEGELIISVETVINNAEIYKTSYFTELLKVMIHGILHLCGYEDNTGYQKRKMRNKENIFLKALIENKK